MKQEEILVQLAWRSVLERPTYLEWLIIWDEGLYVAGCFTNEKDIKFLVHDEALHVLQSLVDISYFSHDIK